MFWMLIEIYV